MRRRKVGNIYKSKIDYKVYNLPVDRDVIVYRDIIISPMVQVRTRYRALYLLPDFWSLVTTLVKM